jgi:hypothetical protein
VLEPLVLAAFLALGQSDDEEAAPALLAAEVEEPERDADTGIVSLFDYQVSQVSRVEVADGKTRVSVESNAPSPRSGSFPVRFFIDNSAGPTGRITLTIRSNVSSGSTTVTRDVEVNAGERRTVNVPVQSELRYGQVSAQGPGIKENLGASMYFTGTYDPQRVVLTLSQPEAFEKFVGRPPRYSAANVLVHAIPPSEAPSELAAYLGYDLVVVPDGATFDTLDETQRNAVEAYVASGGHVMVGGTVRSPAMFPLRAGLKPGTTQYGFGQLFLTGNTPSSSAEVFRSQFPVSPHGPLPEYERRYNTEAKTELLLPQATAPLGRFLLIITLFTLAIGPGSVWVARRRGPAALLVTIPGTALVTCLMIIGYSLIADGFTVHTASYGFTVLDGKQHRAITHGVTAYYANLAPSKGQLGPSSMLIAPFEDRREKHVASLTWKDGLTLGGDFVPSRTYREWGFVSVEPSRARLVIKPKGDAWVVQNALGTKVDKVMVNIDGRIFTAGPVRDGGEEKLESGNGLSYAGMLGATRFSASVIRTVAQEDLKPRQFVAHVLGDTLVPTAGISSSVYKAEHWIRGEFEE